MELGDSTTALPTWKMQLRTLSIASTYAIFVACITHVLLPWCSWIPWKDEQLPAVLVKLGCVAKKNLVSALFFRAVFFHCVCPILWIDFVIIFTAFIHGHLFFKLSTTLTYRVRVRFIFPLWFMCNIYSTHSKKAPSPISLAKKTKYFIDEEKRQIWDSCSSLIRKGKQTQQPETPLFVCVTRLF